MPTKNNNTITAATIRELRRTLEAFVEYGLVPNGTTHAAAKRASLDLTRQLAKWRKTYTASDGAVK